MAERRLILLVCLLLIGVVAGVPSGQKKRRFSVCIHVWGLRDRSLLYHILYMSVYYVFCLYICLYIIFCILFSCRLLSVNICADAVALLCLLFVCSLTMCVLSSS
eukprot:GHVQ01031739.1.p1 GENE.GHVQ01031739.1~~GHVQ01031739.1.p1  ORF type:complete len:105 (-),score=2.48 GHVQ01031739.1:433-747(-)